MPRGYWIAHIDVSDRDAYPKYVAASTEAVTKHGGRFIVRGGACEQVEGSLRARHAVIEFATYAAALAAYTSPDYTAARLLRQAAADADITIVEGYGD